ncbi:MAG: TRAP transporter substrate-binding protein [Pseudobdellovibrio sp.]
MKQTKKIRWVLAHEPIDLFLRAAKRFSQEIAKTSHGELDIEVMTLSEYSNRYANGRTVTKHELLDLMDTGDIEMSQMYTTTLGKFNKDMFALDMPFLFRNHEHASSVLEGNIGKSLMDGLSDSSNIQGLAFTYSGGYRMIASNTPITSIEDFKGLKIRIAKSPVAEDSLKAVGAIPIPMELEELNNAIGQDLVSGGESTYPRFYSMKQNEVATVINDTRHSLFLTSILVSKKFWATLDQDLQTIMSKAAIVAAHAERIESVDDIKVVQDKCKNDGVAVIELSHEEQTKFKAATQSVYTKYEDFFTAGLIKKIINTH